MSTMPTIQDQLRAAIRATGLHQREVARDLGIHESAVSRFMAGAALRGDNVDTLADYLELELQPRRKGKARKATGGDVFNLSDVLSSSPLGPSKPAKRRKPRKGR